MTTITPLDRGPRIPRESARQWAQQIIQQMRPLSHRIEVAGSVRRLCVGGTNFGSLLLFRTGSVRHSQWLQQRAVRLGMRWNPAFGLYRERQLIAADTEDEIYQALGVQFVEPEARAANPSGLQAA